MRCCEVLGRVDWPWAGRALSASSRQEVSELVVAGGEAVRRELVASGAEVDGGGEA